MSDLSKNKGEKGRTVSIDANDSGRRLDLWLYAHYQHLARSSIQKLIRKKYVYVNDSRARAHYRLQAGDRIALPRSFDARDNPDPSIPSKQPIPKKPSRNSSRYHRQAADRIKKSLIFEDDHYLCLNKPAGLSVHSGTGARMDLKNLARLAWPQFTELELAHRLDKDTGGCLLLAKNWRALQSFHRELRQRRVEKEYIAILHKPHRYPRLSDANRSIDVDSATIKVASQACISNEPITMVAPLSRVEGKPLDAKTVIDPMRDLGSAVMARIRIETGRHHQIRLHAAMMRQPVLGDRRYGLSVKLERALGLSCPRLMLHARSLKFSGEREYAFIAPLPPDFEDWLATHSPHSTV